MTAVTVFSTVGIIVTTVTERDWKMKNIQISEELFIALVRFHLLGAKEEKLKIERRLQDKLDAIEKRNLYTKYKTASAGAEKENARRKYADIQGIPDKFRW